MATIIAQGEYLKTDVIITAEGTDKNYTIDVEPEILKKEITELIDKQMKKGPSLAGTYLPEDAPFLYMHAVLKFEVFEDRPKIIIRGDNSQFPYQEGVIY